MALNLDSVANWPAQVARFPDYFVVSLVRALNRDSGVAASTPEGAADAKDWLEQFGMERSEDIRKLIRSKHLQTLIYAKKWQQRYPGATPEASRLAMEIASDALGLKRPGDEKTIEFSAHWWSNGSEHVMIQMWMPSDLGDAMPVACVQFKVGEPRSRIMLNRDREDTALQVLEQLPQSGYAMLADPAIEIVAFHTDTQDSGMQLLPRSVMSADGTDFGSGLY